MMHQIAKSLPDHHCYFTPFYCDGIYRFAQKLGWLDFTIIGGQNRASTEKYLAEHKLPVDYAGQAREYDLYLTCTDLLVQNNLIGKKVILVQEGMTDPENIFFHIVKMLRPLPIPRWIASTSTSGLSDCYDKFCVASDGYRDLFARKGVRPEKIEVTGIPNFDHAAQHLKNSFPHRGYVLAATSDTRENFKWDNRKKFIEKVGGIAAGRQVIFKLHPNENKARSTSEIHSILPKALVFDKGNTSEMIANCDVLITQYSSVAFIGLALGKEVHSYFDVGELRRLLPIQNGGTSGENIAKVCRNLMGEKSESDCGDSSAQRLYAFAQ